MARKLTRWRVTLTLPVSSIWLLLPLRRHSMLNPREGVRQSFLLRYRLRKVRPGGIQAQLARNLSIRGSEWPEDVLTVFFALVTLASGIVSHFHRLQRIHASGRTRA